MMDQISACFVAPRCLVDWVIVQGLGFCGWCPTNLAWTAVYTLSSSTSNAVADAPTPCL